MTVPQVGGRYRLTMRLTADLVIPLAGVFKAIDRPSTLALTWGRESNPSQATLLTLTLRQQGNATQLTLRQVGLGSVASRDEHNKGRNSTLDKLVRHLAAASARQ